MSPPETESQTPAVQRFEVYCYDLPKVGEDGKSIPTDPAETREFAGLEEARKFAVERKGDFDRIVLMQTSGEDQTLVERFRDGDHIVPEGAKSSESKRG